jgi:hypothetical protein
MNTPHTLTRIIAGALLSGGVAITGFGLAAGTAQAEPGFAPQVYWCPDQSWDPAWGENKHPNECWDTDRPPPGPPPTPFDTPSYTPPPLPPVDPFLVP